MDFMGLMNLTTQALAASALVLIHKQSLERRQRRNRRRYWVHPLVSHRLTKGHFNLIFSDLRKYDDKFFEFTRMSVSTFDELLNLLRPALTRQNTRMRQCITPEERLLVTLRFLATGASFTSLHFYFLLGKMTICRIVNETCITIWEVLKLRVMAEPTEEIWRAISEGFFNTTQFPHCVGAIDGKHVRVQMPPNSGSRFYNYKKYFSLVLMAIADSNYQFIDIDVRAYGSSVDSNVFRQSPMGRKILQGNFNLPPPEPLPGTRKEPFPFVFVADKAFALHVNIMKPFPKRGLDERRRVFNYRLTRARRLVECAFGILTTKWRFLLTSIMMDVERVDTAVKAACVLHNFVRQRELGVVEDSLCDMESVSWAGIRSGNPGMGVRNMFADYFMSPEGILSWQYDMI